jgi:mRNA interferase MazF
MNEASIVLAAVPQNDGTFKPRPVLLLRSMPPFGDFLVCGISSQLQQEVPGFDERIASSDPDFAQSHLAVPSLVRLGFLALLPKRKALGHLGSISADRHARLLQRLSAHLLAANKSTR